MTLYLVQHAEALNKEVDPSRSLSDKGMKEAQKVAAFIARLNVRVDRVFHSGKMRAMQTGRIMAESLGFRKELEQVDGLAPTDDPGIWLKRLDEITEDIMLVGHLPHLGNLANLLLCKEMDRSIIAFEMGNVVCLRRGDDGNLPGGQLSWFVDFIIKPKMLE